LHRNKKALFSFSFYEKEKSAFDLLQKAVAVRWVCQISYRYPIYSSLSAAPRWDEYPP